MAELYFPFASAGGDRKVGPETYERMLGAMFTAGVFPRGEMLAVKAAGGMKIAIATGGAVVIREDPTSAGPHGYLYHNTVPKQLVLNVADGVAARIDALVLRWSRIGRSVTLAVLTGTPAASPTPPELTRNSDFWELRLADVHIAAGTTEITQAMIYDKRESADCGIVSSLAQLDGAELYARQEDVFARWFAQLTTILTGDIAGNLANQILYLKNKTEHLHAELYNGDVDVAPSQWSYNAAEMRYEATVNNPMIRTDTDVLLTLSDEQKGKYSIGVLDPKTGAITLYTDTAPTSVLHFRLSIWEVRTDAD